WRALTARDAGRAVGHGALGLGQAVAFVLVALGPGRSGGAAAVPLLLGVPLTEVLIGRYAVRCAVALDDHEDRTGYHRQVRRLGLTTLAALVPPLTCGVALATAAGHLPYGLASHPDVRAGLLRLASGVLLAGAYGVLLLLAIQRRLGTAVLLASWPAALAAVVAAGYLLPWAPVPWPLPDSLAGWADALLPATVGTLTAAYLAGLAVAAYAVLDPRSA
ncbi:MAG TPA: hypothetical protein VFE14_10960, partial [Micromonosporaceae bacterium]|nr:hypothetical protein [Micromonosporaceae bacterium]